MGSKEHAGFPSFLYGSEVCILTVPGCAEETRVQLGKLPSELQGKRNQEETVLFLLLLLPSK